MTTPERDLAAAVVPPRSLPTRRTSARKEQILDGLQEIVLTKGFRSLRLTDVAAQLNTSFATLYQLAPTKDELVSLVVDRWYQQSTPVALKRMRRGRTPQQRLQRWARSGVEGLGSTAPAFWEDVATHASIAQIVANHSHYYVRILEAIIDDGVRDGTFRPVNARLVGLTWEAAGAQLRDPLVVERFGKTLAELGEEWVDIILHGLLAP